MPTEDRDALAADEARALFESARRGEPGADESCELAIIGENAEILYATPAAVRLFEAKGRADLQRALGAGESPNARRLRHLAATLPIGGPPRLERMRFTLGRRSTSVNLLCARVSAASGGTVLALSTPEPDNSELPAGPDAPPVSDAPVGDVSVDAVAGRVYRAPQPVERRASSRTPYDARRQGRGPRFLWTLDSDGRFGATDPVLIAALGAAAPEPGETLERLCLRAEIERADELADLIDKRETFSDLALIWRRIGKEQKLRVTLSAAPAFDSRRDFAGYRGFGVLHEAIGVVPGADEADDQSDQVQSDREPPSDESAGSDAPPVTEAAMPEDATPSPHPQKAAEEGEANPIASAQVEAHAAPSLPANDESGGRQPVTALPESGGAGAAQSGGPHERTAAIYFLRQGAAPSKIIPLRPGAVDALASRDPAQAGGDGIELSRSERDAFREIARALVGRPQALRQDGEIEPAAPAAEADAKLDEGFRSPAPLAEREGQGVDEAAGRNAAGLLDRLPVGVLVARDARALYLNRALLDLLGYRDLEHFQSSDGLAMMFRGHDPQSVSVEDDSALSIVKSDGHALAVEGHAQAVLWDGAPATLFSLRPSTEAELEKKLRQPEREAPAQIGSAAELREMLDRATDGAVILDAAGRILSFNRSAERLFGYEQREVAGESVLMLLAPQSHPEATARLDRLSRADETPEPERPLAVVGRGRDGGALTLALILARIGSPEAFSYCALVRDLSREREAEGRLMAARDAALAASAAKTDFLAQVSHEIRTPLHAILGFAEVMMEERFGPIGNDRYRDYLKDIHASGKHVMSLADDLLDLSKIESGKLELAFAPVDANSLIRECLSLMQPQAARERVILRVSLFERLPRVMVDERSLRQVMLNLMSNAVKFNEPGGQVIVSTAVDAGGQAVIRVRDTGVGMSESEVGRALEPFGQIGRAGRKGGVGLGLPLTKALVEANKAEFSIESRREHGTLIEIAFPVVQAAQ
ncbi:MAG TPA: ATP-binding protein [Roseiarcus sp.]|nr:ATP-binding protein [Roseiarcus sp.]